MEVPGQGYRPRHTRCSASECHHRTVEKHLRGRILCCQATTSARHAATAIRGHWHIENKLHYIRDVTFQEDQSRIRHNPGVFARLRSFAYNILRRNRTSTFSQDRYAAALAGLDELLTWSFSGER